MADDSIQIIEPLDFHPCNTPRGCVYYDTKILTECQQLKLNEMKMTIIKSDEKYLRQNPEVRAFVALITRYVLKKRPRRYIPTLIKEFFDRPKRIIEDEVDKYIRSRPPVEEEDLTETEEDAYSEDFQKYLESLQATVEEEASRAKRPPAVEDSNITENFIRQLLIDRIRTFPLGDKNDKDQSNDPPENRKTSRSTQSSRKASSSVEFANIDEQSHGLPLEQENPKSLISIVSLIPTLPTGAGDSSADSVHSKKKIDSLSGVTKLETETTQSDDKEDTAAEEASAGESGSEAKPPHSRKGLSFYLGEE